MSTYIHGTDADEQARLSRLNDLLNAASLRELALAGGERILDVGAGLAQLARAMARADGRPVVGVEASAEQLARAEALAREAGEERLVVLRRGDASALPLERGERGAFDVVHARFLLEHVPDPLAVVREMVAAARPGGRIVLADDDHDVLRLWPEPAGFAPVWAAYQRCYDRAGNDPIVGRRLVQLLADAGAAPRRCSWVFFGSCAGAPDFPAFAANLAHVVAQARAPMAALGLAGAALDEALAALDAWARRPDAALWYAMAWAEGVREE
jgi:SAM-dependent methyltransferase